MSKTITLALILSAAFVSLGQADKDKKEVRNYTNADLSAFSLFNVDNDGAADLPRLLTKDKFQSVLERVADEITETRRTGNAYANVKRANQFQVAAAPLSDPSLRSAILTVVRIDVQEVKPELPEGVTLTTKHAGAVKRLFDLVSVTLIQGDSRVRFSIRPEYIFHAIYGPTQAFLEDAEVVGVYSQGLGRSIAVNELTTLYLPQLQGVLSQVFDQQSASK
ncbi:MAG: hypothetical protein HY401_05560 [Elusimicrobia bacterium]|nr:hypothetical protein [Elusimicrobiota bacterium]